MWVFLPNVAIHSVYLEMCLHVHALDHESLDICLPLRNDQENRILTQTLSLPLLLLLGWESNPGPRSW